MGDQTSNLSMALGGGGASSGVAAVDMRERDVLSRERAVLVCDRAVGCRLISTQIA